MISLYHPGDSPLHRMGSGWKLAALVSGGTVLFQLDGLAVMFAALALVVGLYVLARVPAATVLAQLRPALVLLGLVFVAQAILVGLTPAAVIVLRFGVLILAAALVTLTTRAADIVAGIERAMTPLGRWIAVDKVSLAMAMTIRFIPLISAMVCEVREAQRVRGLERSVFAIAMPVIVRTLKMSTAVAEALDARGFGGARRAVPGTRVQGR